ncbi:ATP-binding protein [Amaricoccus sp.]|uniref:sensor histidine kinase n=1 Tax=Amaricoccus sp. TaxID=1872485 RepID=UPI0025C6A1F1|nr:ATP-binding protein [Amaricoccus sp.]
MTRPGGPSWQRLRRAAIEVALALALWAVASAAPAEETPVRRILIVYQHDSLLPANIEAASGIEAALAAGLGTRRETFTEYLDLDRFPGPEHRARLVEMLAEKYADMPLDVVIVGASGALRFVLEHRDAFAPGVPIVFGGLSAPEIEEIAPPPDVFGAWSAYDIQGSVDLARRLQPDAERLVVMSGSAGLDRVWDRRARNEIKAPGLGVEFLTDLSLEGFKSRASTLGRDTILLVLGMNLDADGRTLVGRAAAAEIAAASGAPAYGIFSTYVGVGFVGGSVETFRSIGEAMGNLALKVMADPATAPHRITTPARPMVDWRQVRRWGINPELLPPDTLRLYYEPTAWERYWREIVLAAAVILLQSATIVALIIQSRRRRRIEAELAEERLELAHLARRTQLGELSGAVAHELNQPLTAILANAEAGAKLLAQEPPDLAEVGAILDDIAADDRRAADIIAQLRRLMIKGDAELVELDLNQVVANTVGLARSELVARQTTVEVQTGEAALSVRGNLSQLQQIVLNLTLNAAEAMAELPPSERKIEVEARARDDGTRLLAVSDRGRGMTPERQAEAFRPFVTSKPGGLGFGLSICRTIAQAHGGTLDFDLSVKHGARVVLVLPAP